jgi:hypothetical protein
MQRRLVRGLCISATLLLLAAMPATAAPADLPGLDALHGKVVIAVNVDHSRAGADRFLSELGPSLRVLYDPEGALAEQFHVRGMPTSFLIHRDGNVQLQHAGFRIHDRDELAGRIRALLGAHY